MMNFYWKILLGRQYFNVSNELLPIQAVVKIDYEMDNRYLTYYVLTQWIPIWFLNLYIPKN